MKTRFACPCCGFLTQPERPPGTFEICDVCHWQSDPIQDVDLDYEGGANEQSLRTARANFAAFRAADERFRDRVREPTAEEKPHDV
jgi:hypothetical protein